MSEPSQLSQTSQSSQMRRVSAAERILSYIAVGLAAVTAAYLLFMLLSEHETCYGMQASKLLCQPVDAVAAARGALVLLFPGVLFIGGAIGGIWQTRARLPESRNAAYGLLVTCTLLLVGIIVPALAGAGFFLLPATLVMVVAAILGTVKFVQDWRVGSPQAS